MYADDVQFLHSCPASDFVTLKTRVEQTLYIANDWFAENSLKVNPSKTELMIVKTR